VTTKERSAGDTPPRTGRQSRFAPWVPAAGVVGAAAAVLAIPGFLGWVTGPFHGDPPPPPACAEGPSSAAKVEANSAIGETFNYTVRIKCPPAAGHQYVAIFKLSNLGAPPHPVYYCKQKYEDVKADTSDTQRESVKGPVGSVREIYVVQIAINESDRCNPDGLDNEGVLEPPSTAVVSNTVTVTRRW
jgi:hypothetical protein